MQAVQKVIVNKLTYSFIFSALQKTCQNAYFISVLNCSEANMQRRADMPDTAVDVLQIVTANARQLLKLLGMSETILRLTNWYVLSGATR
jgi:hypothetical protein